MDENEMQIVRYIRNLRPAIMADGHIDMDETAWLLKTIRPLENQLGGELRDFVELLRKVRADGVVTPAESKQIIQMMDEILARLSK